MGHRDDDVMSGASVQQTGNPIGHRKRLTRIRPVAVEQF